MTDPVRTWRYSLAARVGLGLAALFLYGVAVFIADIPAIAGGPPDPVAGWILAACGAGIAALASFMAFGWLAVVRTRITVGGTALDAVVPDRHDWLLVPHFRTVHVPLASIARVETRQEVARSAGFPTLRDSLSVVTAGGERIGLVSATAATAAQLPVAAIAAGLAAAASVAVTFRGTVRTKDQGLYGIASSHWDEAPLDAASAAKARHGAVVTAQIVFALMMFTMLLRGCG